MANGIIDGDLDPTNVMLIVPALFVSIAMAFFGFQSNNLGLLAAGLVLFLLPATGLILTRLDLINSGKPFYYTALAYIIGNAVFLLPGFLGNFSFSILSAPSASYLSAALGETSTEVTAIMNNFLAPRGENVALLGLSVVLLLTAREITDNLSIQAFVAIVPTAITFAVLHGVRTVGFLLLAASFMAIWIALYIGDELGFGDVSELAIAGFSLTVGLHQGNNISSTGGLSNYYSTLLSAQEPIIYISYLIIFIDAFLLGYVIYKTVDLLGSGELEIL